MEITLKDLVGDHTLDFAAVTDSLGDGTGIVQFFMDGKTFTAVEDPDDGYRSFLEGIYVGPNNKYLLAPPINREVRATHEDSDQRDLLTITDIETGHVWLEIGTEDTDDWYPYCVMHWNAMAPNPKGK